MKKNHTVYDHIKSNNIKTALLVASFPLLFLFVIFLCVWIVADARTSFNIMMSVGIPTTIACFIWLGISWAFGDNMMLSSAGAKQINQDQKEYKEVFRAVENVALAAGLPTPKVYIIKDGALNAFATGKNPNNASVALTAGIIEKLDRIELEGVIAHEMAHIGNRDIRLDMLLITGVGVTVFMADIVLRTMMMGGGKSSNDKNNGAAILLMVWLAFLIFNFILTPLLRLAISRNREFAADATAAQITRNPNALASALSKISGNSRVEALDKIKSMAVACIENPGTKTQFLKDFLSTHPSIDERIKRLGKM